MEGHPVTAGMSPLPSILSWVGARSARLGHSLDVLVVRRLFVDLKVWSTLMATVACKSITGARLVTSEVVLHGNVSL